MKINNLLGDLTDVSAEKYPPLHTTRVILFSEPSKHLLGTFELINIYGNLLSGWHNRFIGEKPNHCTAKNGLKVETSVRSPRKSFIFIIEKCIYRIKVSQKIVDLILKKTAPVTTEKIRSEHSFGTGDYDLFASKHLQLKNPQHRRGILPCPYGPLQSTVWPKDIQALSFSPGHVESPCDIRSLLQKSGYNRVALATTATHSCWRAGFWHCGRPAKCANSCIYT